MSTTYEETRLIELYKIIHYAEELIEDSQKFPPNSYIRREMLTGAEFILEMALQLENK